MIVYRVEDGEGRGPYRCYCSNADLAQMWERHRGEQWPIPYRDRLLYDRMPHHTIEDQYRFCFASMTSFHAWFSDDDRDILHRADFRLSVYEVPAEQVVEGDKQALFKASEALRLSSTSLFSIEGIGVSTTSKILDYQNA